MQKQAPTLGRLLTMVAFALSCFGLLLFLWLAFGGPTPLKPKGYQFGIAFSEGTQLAQEADVRISGVSVGKVKTIVANGRTGRSDATIELESRYAPLPRDSKAILRQKTLLGETYVELTPGDKRGPKIPEGGKLGVGQISPTVELDEIFRAFDPRTRHNFRVWMQSMAQSVNGRGRDLSDALGNLEPFAQDTTTVLETLNAQGSAVRKLVANTGTVFDALSQRDGQLRGLIENSNRVFETTSARDQELKDTFRALPTFNAEARRTVVRLSDFSAKTDPLISQLRPAARELSPTLTQLAALAPDLKALFVNLGPLITASEKGLPATQRFINDLRPFLASVDAPLHQLNPILAFIAPYRREIGAFFANSAAATQAIARGGGAKPTHYLRTTNPTNPENLAVYPRRIGSNRTNPYEMPGAFDQLAKGLPSFDTRHCNAGTPRVDQAALQSSDLPQEVKDGIQPYFFTNAPQVPRPPCRQQGRYTTGGRTTQYPQVQASGGRVARSAGK
jgi:phospholipid/cholesterol/gamma-HCH transport system substrate-binding protein